MADIKFSCPNCQQNITCDELWGGHQIDCPSCKGPLTVPQPTNQAAAQQPPVATAGEKSFVPPVPHSTKLSVKQPAHEAKEGGAEPAKHIPIRNLAPKAPKKKNIAVTILSAVGVVAALGVGGYFGFNWWTKHQEEAETKAKTEAAAATNSIPVDPAVAQAAAEAAAAAVAAAIEASLPVIPAVWSLDVQAAHLPNSKLNGRISGKDVLIDSSRLDRIDQGFVLHLVCGETNAPDQELLVLLRVPTGESIKGKSWTISKEQRGPNVPQVMKRWKTGPQSPLTSKTYGVGYAMKLEFGDPIPGGSIPGRIYIALPDDQQSVLGGIFRATANLGDSPGGSPTPDAAPTEGRSRRKRTG